jgi:Putative sugar-binding domain
MPKRPTNSKDSALYTQASVFDEYLYSICHQFLLEEKTSDEVASWVRETLKKKGLEAKFTRQQVYPMIARALRQGIVHLIPPREHTLAQRIADLSKTHIDNIEVIAQTGSAGHDALAARAAGLISNLINHIARVESAAQGKNIPVHLGIGSGYTTSKVAQHLGWLLRSDKERSGLEKLVVHAMSSGVDDLRPHLSPVAQFSYFSDSIPKVEFVGLFTEPVVHQSEYEALKRRPGAVNAFEDAKNIQIVVSSLGSAHDHRSLFNSLHTLDEARSQALAGDFHYRPYSKTGPILESREDDERVVTLFDITDFIRMSQQNNKYVVVVAAPNSDGTTKAAALAPLVRQPSLHVWTHLCLEAETARELVSILTSPAE